MLTYMACGLPVVVSPVGMNGEILSQGTVGFGPKSKDEWISALCFLSENRKERVQMGNCGRQVVLEKYSIDMVAKALANSLLKTAGLRAR
jgi:glycosyltransferase involved in cell wall biosynthesis